MGSDSKLEKVISFAIKNVRETDSGVREDTLKKILFVIMVLVCVMFVAGCSKFTGGDKGKAALKSDVVAQVGDDKITAQDIEEILTHIPMQYRTRYSSAEGRREIVDGLVNIKTLAWEARKRGIDKQNSVRMKISYLTDQTLAKELENELKKAFKVSDAEIEKYYNDHQEKYVTPDRIKARHILVDKEDQARSLLKQIKKGADFELLAKQNSKCPSAPKGGDLGWFSKGKMDPAFEKAAFVLKNGEVSDVVKSSFGYHIIRLDDRRENKTRTLDQVRRSIERIIQREKMEKEVNALKENIKKQASVSVNDEYFKKFEGRAQTQTEDPGFMGPGSGPGPQPAPVQAPVPGPAASPAPPAVQGR